MPRSITPLLLGLPVFALLLWLGFWQLDRADQKRTLADQYEAAANVAPVRIDTAAALAAMPRHARVAASGRFIGDRQVLLDAQTHDGVVGYRVWTPLALDHGDWVLIDRGWVAAGATRADLPDVAVGASRRTVTGRKAPLPVPGLRLGEPEPAGGPWPRRLVWPDADALARAFGRAVPPALILLDADEPDGFVREWAPADTMTAQRHVGYAVQWFALAAALVVIALVLMLRKRRHD